MSSLLALLKQRAPSWAPLLAEAPRALAFAHLELRVQPGARVLDLGSGRGHDAAVLAEAGARAVGLDLHWPSLRRGARANPRVWFVVGRAESLPFRDGSFAALYAHSVLQYTDRDRALAECRRVLAPRGRFAIVENLEGNPVARLYRGWRRLCGARFPDHLRPRRHLVWTELESYRRHFGPVEAQPFHLATPALAGLKKVRSGNAGSRRGFAARVRRFDEWLLSTLPWLRRWAWLVVVRGERGADSAPEE